VVGGEEEVCCGCCFAGGGLVVVIFLMDGWLDRGGWVELVVRLLGGGMSGRSGDVKGMSGLWWLGSSNKILLLVRFR
jgi:hypothetical protein